MIDLVQYSLKTFAGIISTLLVIVLYNLNDTMNELRRELSTNQTTTAVHAEQLKTLDKRVTTIESSHSSEK